MLPDMLDRTKMIYKGDVLAGSVYLVIGVLAAIAALLLYVYSIRLGFRYLTKGMSFFALYMIGKGGVMMYMYWSRYRYYKISNELTSSDVSGEKEYTTYRIAKKLRSRRIYMYIIFLGCTVAFAGIFHQEKGMIVATCIPIILMSAIEFGVGLLMEFRLSEYLRQLEK